MFTQYTISKTLFVFTLFLLFSCGNNSSENERKSDSVIVVNSQKENAEVKKDNFTEKSEPITLTKEFTSYLKFLDSLGWISDTNRLKKVAGYNDLKEGNVQIINGRTAFIIGKRKHGILNRRFPRANHDSIEFKKQLPINLLQVDSIFGFFFGRKDTASGNYVIDFIMEVWKYPTYEKAQTAWNWFEKYAPGAYTDLNNTLAVIIRKENYFYIFTSRSAAFCYGLKKEERKFLELFSGTPAGNKENHFHWVN